MILLDQAGAAADSSALLAPPPAQAPFVEHLWIQLSPQTRDGRSWRIIPEAHPNLIFVAARGAGGRIITRCTLVGARSRFANVSVAGRILTCGARLRPGALPLLTRLPARDFTDHAVPVEDVFGGRGRSLACQLADATSARQAIGVLSDFLGRELAGCEPIARMLEGRHERVAELARQAGMPARTLRSRMLQDVGLSPKRALRIERLHRALAGCQRPGTAWADLAARCGFADQAHMVREFQDLLGESPTAWVSRCKLPIRSRQRKSFPGRV